MFCPKCGKESSNDQNFCRSCGLNIGRVEKALETEFDSSELAPSPNEASQRALRRAFKIMPWALVLMFCGAVIGIVGKQVTHNEVAAAAGAIIAVFGIFAVAFPFVSPACFRQTAPRKKANTKALREAGRLALAAEPVSVPASSVTEATTRQLAERQSAPRDAR